MACLASFDKSEASYEEYNTHISDQDLKPRRLKRLCVTLIAKSDRDIIFPYDTLTLCNKQAKR